MGSGVVLRATELPSTRRSSSPRYADAARSPHATTTQGPPPVVPLSHPAYMDPLSALLFRILNEFSTTGCFFDRVDR
jgi:hypothetical protein